MRIYGRSYSTFGPAYMRYPGHIKLQIQRQRMAQVAQQAKANRQALSNGFFGANLSLAQGLANITVQAAAKRTQDLLSTKQTEATSLASQAKGIDLTV